MAKYFLVLEHSEDGERVIEFEHDYEASAAFGHYMQMAVQHAEYRRIQMRAASPEGTIKAVYDSHGVSNTTKTSKTKS